MIKEIKANEIENTIKNYKLISLLNIITFICISFVIFGIFSLGFFVAPIIFSHLTPRAVASETMTLIFMKYYPFAFVCSIIALLSETLNFFLNKKNTKSKLNIISLVSVILIFFISGYTSQKIAPEINQMRLEQKGPTLWTNPEFVKLHKESESLSKGMFMIGLIPLIIMIIKRK